MGTHIALKMNSMGFLPVQIINRSQEKAKKLADLTNCNNYTTDLKKISRSDFILVTVNDDSLQDVLNRTEAGNTPVFHCSGSTSMSVFPTKIPHHGVLYPLQTFSLWRDPDFEEIPFLLEASDDQTMHFLKNIAREMSNHILEINSEDRLKYHIAAVFASNFVNHFLTLAYDYLRNHDLHANVLNPLIQETFLKFIEGGDLNTQTGPAVREDKKTLQKHEEMLKNDPDFQKIYTFVSRSIINHKIKEEK